MDTGGSIISLLAEIVRFVADLSTIGASAIAIYLFLFKRDEISSAFRTLLGFAAQLTLTELYQKLERLNDLTAADPEQLREIVNLLNDILGQIRGNSLLSDQCRDLASKIEKLANIRLTEPKKRALVSEIRERLRSIEVGRYRDLPEIKK
jgi:hypothetical protein